MIQGISDTLLKTAMSAAILGNKDTSSEEDLTYLAIVAFFRIQMQIQMHQSMMDTWKKYAQNRKERAEESDADHRAQEQRQSELAGQRSRIEYFQQNQEGEYVRCAVHGQMAKRKRSYEVYDFLHLQSPA